MLQSLRKNCTVARLGRLHRQLAGMDRPTVSRWEFKPVAVDVAVLTLMGYLYLNVTAVFISDCRVHMELRAGMVLMVNSISSTAVDSRGSRVSRVYSEHVHVAVPRCMKIKLFQSLLPGSLQVL